ncbi:hypothetical protein [Hymenobacter sp. BRD67]|uniref:hypothetical protein n=1 Tax=Hymenobacter sp. BRD67 TaxID=2675877 RepID=UPI001566DECD|nr:hypothetical protein [Hymenobacter sp. BRD67]QKG53244.1 hypothetical protein GKZ67_12410 [Hymenobacter sp. BRD67]
MGYTVWQLLPRQREALLPLRINALLTWAVLATTGWTLVFSYELISASLTLMLLILLLLAQAYGRARALVLAGQAPAWPVWFLSFYLGWILLATVLNVIFALRDGFGWQWSAEASRVGCYVLLVVAAGLGVALAWRHRDALLPLPVAWGLIGTWQAQHIAEAGLATASLAAAAVLLAGAAVVAWQSRPA